MAFADIYNRVNATMSALITAAGYPSLVPGYAFGPAQKAFRQVPPRVAWSFKGDKFTAKRLLDTRPPRSIQTRNQAFELELWAPCQIHSPVFQQGSFGGTVVPSGQPAVSGIPTTFGMAIQILAGASTFQWSTDSGKTWTISAIAATVVLGSTGITIAMTGTFQAGDQFWWIANDFVLSDFATAEWLLNVLIVALHTVLVGSYQLGDGKWENQDGADSVQEGKLYKLDLTVESPILEMFSPALSSKLVTSIQQTDIIGSTITIP